MRQAVVIVHGIGEQRPMSTLRAFVKAVIPEPAVEGCARYHNKPDRLSETFELRRLQGLSSRRAPTTDYYEFYWAYHSEGTRFAHILTWLRTLLLRTPGQVPERLLPTWLLAWCLIATAAILWLANPSAEMSIPSIPGIPERWTLPLATLLLIPLSQYLALHYIGDAARYLDPAPGNIALRQKIRADGVQLLRKLHAEGKYNRIVLVGHSLGSVIAYDILRQYWVDVHQQHRSPATLRQPELKACEQLGKALGAEPSAADLTAYRKAQRELWKEQRGLGNPWLVTDLVTLGSPLAHARLLLAKGENDLRERMKEMELPTCPPQLDNNTHHYDLKYAVQGSPRSIHVLTHSALFACTRWTNIYFPGDLVGGPMAPVFGAGIEDVRVEGGGLVGRLPLSHTRYWHKENGDGPAERALMAALDLQSRDWLV